MRFIPRRRREGPSARARCAPSPRGGSSSPSPECTGERTRATRYPLLRTSSRSRVHARPPHARTSSRCALSRFRRRARTSPSFVESAALRSVRRLGITAAIDARLVCCCGRHAANNAARAEGSRVIAPSRSRWGAGDSVLPTAFCDFCQVSFCSIFRLLVETEAFFSSASRSRRRSRGGPSRTSPTRAVRARIVVHARTPSARTYSPLRASLSSHRDLR